MVRYPADHPPTLLVTIDTEEEFDWSTFSSEAVSVTNLRHLVRAQRIFDRHGVVPTYLVDYPVVAAPEAARPLREILADGRCEIGAHLHPWVTPPIEEEVCTRNSFACNLPPDLERRKLETLTTAIEEAFGVRPLTYRAGRYGIGPRTLPHLAGLGYRIDCSVVPWHDYGPKGGPDFTGIPASPYWVGDEPPLLEIPFSVGIVGRLARWAGWLYPRISTPAARRAKLTAICATFGLLDRIRLTPEGITLDEAKRLTRALAAGGHKLFQISYHSPSLEPGFTPYVRNRADLATFLSWLDGYLDFFFGEMRGLSSTFGQVWTEALRLRAR